MVLSKQAIDQILQNQVCDFGNDSKRLMVRNEDSNKLLIVLSTHNQKNVFFAVRKLLSNFKVNLLFLTDFHNSYFLENKKNIKETSYYQEISKCIELFGVDNVSIFGSSMAGYAAIKYGTLFNINIIATNPQLDLDISYPFAWENLRKTFDKIRYFSPISSNQYNGRILVFFGYHPIDCVNYNFFIDTFKKTKNGYGVIRLATDEHDFPFSNNPNVIYDFLDISDKLFIYEGEQE